VAWTLSGLTSAQAAGPNPLSPGRLSRAHAKLDDKCERCHASGDRVEASRCLACHGRVELPLERGEGFHARQIRETGKGCGACHQEHRGRAFPLIRWAPPADFDHERETTFALRGAHEGLDCGACHERRPSYMGAPRACVGCHDDPHDHQLGRDCARCHDEARWRPASGFSHDKTDFPLDGAHARVRCARCHRTRTGKTVYEVAQAKRCDTCHADPHAGRTALSSCASCHTTEGWNRVRSVVPPSHGPGGFPLTGKHARLQCVDCHGPKLAVPVDRRCASCHRDPHQGALGPRCEDCHDAEGWKHLRPKGLKRFNHDTTAYPLRGAHRRVPCASCHRAGKYKGLRFDRCARCHRRWHPETFVTARPATRCEACHEVGGFTPSTFSLADHDRARYRLTGAHLATPCAACHTAGASPGGQAGGQAKRRVANPGPTPLHMPQRTCRDCHGDPHGGQFDALMDAPTRHPNAGADTRPKGCQRCHDTAGWRDAEHPFDHDTTRFPLRGAHAHAACASCHKAVSRPDGGPAVVQYTGLSLRCEGCHDDVHRGQFAVPSDRAKRCDDCHGTERFALPDFDHAAKTRFPLDGKHAQVPCAKCHHRVALGDGLVAVDYRLGERTCADCHANPHVSAGGRP